MASTHHPDNDRLYSLITALSRSLGASTSSSSRGVDGVATASVAMLSKMISKYEMTKVSVQQCQRALLDHAPDKEAYAAKYHALKDRGVPELDRYLMVVSRILADPDMRNLLSAPTSTTDASAADEQHSAIPSNPNLERDAARSMRTSASSLGDRPEMASPTRAKVSINTQPLFTTSSTVGLPATHEKLASTLEQRPIAALPQTAHPAVSIAPIPSRPTAAVTPKMSGWTGSEEAGAAITSNSERPRLQEGLNYPSLPSWNKCRSFLTGAHLVQGMGSSSSAHRQPIGTFPPNLQEMLLMDDLLYVMLGIEGKYIRAKPVGKSKGSKSPVAFEVEPGMDPALHELVMQFLPLCNCVVAIQLFIETRSSFEHGLVSHALAASLRVLIHDWRTMVAQLEHQLRIGRLSLQAMWFYCHPAASSLTLLADICSRTSLEQAPLRGAELLNLLQHWAGQLEGDREARAVLMRLQKAAAVPYCRVLARWLYEGVVEDPYGEFLIVEREDLQKESLSADYNAVYWQQRYTLRTEVPHFLANDAETILTTGKYLNAVRECGKTVVCPWLDSIEYDPAKRTHVERIEAAYRFASKELLCLMKEEHKLLGRLRSIKHYFLLDQSDFLVHFMDIASSELNKKSSDISAPRLQSLLDLSLSVANNDDHVDDLTSGLERSTIINQLLTIFTESDEAGKQPAVTAGSSRLLGWDTFTLDYRAPWPVSLVLSRRSLTKYQLLFRHLFHCKHVERQLAGVWQEHQACTRSVSTVGGALQRAYCLCQRMMHFMQNFEYYMTVEVLEPNWHTMEAKLRAAATVDEVIVHHDFFLDSCMKESMLFWPKILRRLEKIKLLCLQFVATSQSLTPTVGIDPGDGLCTDQVYSKDPKARTRTRSERTAQAREAAVDPTFTETVGQLEEAFHAQLRDLISMLNMSTHLEPNLASLCARLDFNHFYD